MRFYGILKGGNLFKPKRKEFFTMYNKKNIEDIAFCYFSERDVVRHRLVQKIIKAYEKRDSSYKRKAEDK